MCEAFSGQHKVTLLCFKGEDRLSKTSVYDTYGVDSGFKIVFVPGLKNPFLRKVLLLSFALSQILKSRSDIVYARDLPGAMVAALLRRPVIVELHAIPARKVGKRLLGFLLNRETVLRVVCISNALALAIKQEYQAGSDKILVAHDGACCDPNPVTSIRPHSPESRFRAGYFGSLNDGKGIEVIIELARICPWVDFEIFGGNSAEIDRWREKNPLSVNVRFHGYFDHAKISPMLHSVDAVLLPNQQQVRPHGNIGDIGSWTSPLKMFEYMASGVPIVASSINVLKEVLIHEKNSLLCHPEDIEEWRDALGKLRDHPEKGRVMADQARHQFEARYTWKKRAENVLSGLFFESLSNQGR